MAYFMYYSDIFVERMRKVMILIEVRTDRPNNTRACKIGNSDGY
jgi:hypothetical protein